MTEHPNLAAALVAALATLAVVDKSRTAKIESKTGRDFTYDYADLGDVVKLTRPVLAEHGIVVLTPIEEHGNGLKCTVVILHSSAERMDFGPFPFPHGATAQATGSMVTYYRRYALVAALGMAAGDDDDGAEAQAARPTPAARADAQPVSLGDLDGMHPRDVVAALRDRGLPCAGTPEELRERLAEVLANEAAEDVPASSTGRPAQVGGESEVAPDAEAPDSPPATIDIAVRDRLLARLNALPEAARRVVAETCMAATEGRYPSGLTPADVPVVSELIEDGAKSVKPGAALAARAAARTKTSAA